MLERPHSYSIPMTLEKHFQNIAEPVAAFEKTD